MKATTAIEPDGPRARALWWTIVALLALGFVACVAKGADGPADPSLVEARIRGFGETSFTVLGGDGSPSASELCALLATNQDQWRRGLMEVTDLAGYVGMIFRFPADTTSGFHMRNTPMPLSIAWFSADGRFVSAADMEPCPDGEGCPTYLAAGPYRFALEVPRGALAGLGVAPGSVLQLEGPCQAATG